MSNENRQSPVIVAVKLVAGGLAVVVDLFPAIDYFADWAPPFWPPARIVSPVIGIIVFAWVWIEGRKSVNPHRRAMYWFTACVVLFVIYGLLYGWTVERPPTSAKNVRPKQIGFGMWNWSLTEEARIQQKRENLPMALDTPEKLMHHFRVWGGVNESQKIWKGWTIVTAGLLLVAVFFALFICWSVGIGYLCHSLGKNNTS